MDRKQIMSWLEGLAQPDWHEFHSDTEVNVIAESALALLKEQEKEIENLKEIIKKADYTLEIVKDKLNDLLKKTEGR